MLRICRDLPEGVGGGGVSPLGGGGVKARCIWSAYACSCLSLG